MNIYDELQLNQAGSKRLIQASETRAEKLRHTKIYLFKVFLTVAFCMAFVVAYGALFGSDNNIVGVVVLLCVLVFRQADLGLDNRHALLSLAAIFCIFAFAPKLANVTGPFAAFLIHLISIFLLMFLGCHNVIMFNHSTLVLSYLLLFGYDVSGSAYLYRLAALAFGLLLTGVVYYRNHRGRSYKRRLRHLMDEFNLHSARTRWHLCLTLGVSSALLIANLLGLPRAMWCGIVVMSILVPFRTDLNKRVKGRIPGNFAGGALFIVIYSLFPESLRPYIGLIGGIGVGFSATYGWQAVFNALGAISIATTVLGVPGAIFFRIFNNTVGALYAMLFERLFTYLVDKVPVRERLRG